MSKKLPTMSNEVKVALITSAATILAAIISGIFLLHSAASSSSNGTPTPQSTASNITTVTLPTIPTLSQVVNDNSNVLNVTQVKNEAMKLPYSLVITTYNNFTGTQAQFSQRSFDYVSSNPDLIVIDIDTVNRYITIASGSDVILTKSQQADASNAFISYFHAHNGDYTGASIAAIDSLLNSFGNV
jgi:hypothetical protein